MKMFLHTKKHWKIYLCPQKIFLTKNNIFTSKKSLKIQYWLRSVRCTLTCCRWRAWWGRRARWRVRRRAWRAGWWRCSAGGGWDTRRRSGSDTPDRGRSPPARQSRHASVNTSARAFSRCTTPCHPDRLHVFYLNGDARLADAKINKRF